MNHLLLLAVLVIGLAGLPATTRAGTIEDSLQSLADAIRNSNLPGGFEKAFSAMIPIVERMVANDRVGAAVQLLENMVIVTDASGIFPDFLPSIGVVIQELDSTPSPGQGAWYCDADSDGYTVFVGYFSSVPSPPYYDNPLNGFDCNDNDPTNTCARFAYRDDDHDGYTVFVGPGNGYLDSPLNGADCNDNDPENLTGDCIL